MDHKGGDGGSSPTCDGVSCHGHTLGVGEWLIVTNQFDVSANSPWSMTAKEDTYVHRLIPPMILHPSSDSSIVF